MSDLQPVCVHRPQTEWQADLLVQFLRDNEVNAHLANRASVGLWGDGSLPFAQLEVLVPSDQASRASVLIAEFLEEPAEDDPLPETD
ncbi:MAG: hypothetical protein GXY33_03280 [Phycisphaerae bacterium]|nr:hypothetical protein [Phycisphaerae bacterium]